MLGQNQSPMQNLKELKHMHDGARQLTVKDENKVAMHGIL